MLRISAFTKFNINNQCVLICTNNHPFSVMKYLKDCCYFWQQSNTKNRNSFFWKKKDKKGRLFPRALMPLFFPFLPHTHSVYLDILSGIAFGSSCNLTVPSLTITIMNLQMKMDLFTQTYLCAMIFTQWCPLLGKCVTKSKTCAYT